MAAVVNITKDAQFFKDTDRKVRFVPWAELPTPTSAGIPVDASGWQLEYLHAATRGGAPFFTKATGSGIAVAGAYNADPKLHTQYIEVTVARADTKAIAVAEGVHQLRRTDAGASDVLVIGQVVYLTPAHVIA